MAASVAARALCPAALHSAGVRQLSAHPDAAARPSLPPPQPRFCATAGRRRSGVTCRAVEAPPREAGFGQWERDDVAGGGAFGERMVQTMRREAPGGEAGEQWGAGEEEMAVSVECDENGCLMVLAGDGTPRHTRGGDSAPQHLHCDLSGCQYSSVAAASEFRVLEGNGWRLGFETTPASLHAAAAMVGAGGWSVSLSAAEFDDFCKLLQMLRRAFVIMDSDDVTTLNEGASTAASEGSNEVGMQLERGSVWMECVLHRDKLSALNRFLNLGAAHSNAAFAIRFVLRGSATQRQAEGSWPAEAVTDMLRKIDQLSGLGAAASN
ncbi:hypothetical protein CLOM_g7273 [Closterium sp. NIES-68]|nr:hypothetical protein CLOM_g7273 [Closterium sp. NIES-68]